MKVNKLKARMVEKGVSAGEISEFMGINTVTFYRKIRHNYFTVKDLSAISTILGLSNSDLLDIFFEKEGA